MLVLIILSGDSMSSVLDVSTMEGLNSSSRSDTARDAVFLAYIFG